MVCFVTILLAFMEVALSEGYRIPEDIAITGCDDTQEGQYMSPMLTTVSFPVYELGTTAVENLVSKIQGNDIAPITTIAAKPVIHNSCGCHNSENKNSVFFTQNYQEITTLENSILDSMNMSAA